MSEMVEMGVDTHEARSPTDTQQWHAHVCAWSRHSLFLINDIILAFARDCVGPWKWTARLWKEADRYRGKGTGIGDREMWRLFVMR